MEKRNKLWRKRHQWHRFKKRMILQASYSRDMLNGEGDIVQHPHWFDLVNSPWCRAYRTTGRPCSCSVCKKKRYNRRGFDKDTQRIIKESIE